MTCKIQPKEEKTLTPFFCISDQLYLFSCEMNYRPDHCMYMSICKPAEKTGAFVLHGCRRVWFNDKQPAFKAVYSAFKEVSGFLRVRLKIDGSTKL
jgi:UDP-xylose:glucoside alpha-1,3-xylosyltransferase